MKPVSDDAPTLPAAGSPSTLPTQATAAAVLLLAGAALVLASRRRWFRSEPTA